MNSALINYIPEDDDAMDVDVDDASAADLSGTTLVDEPSTSKKTRSRKSHEEKTRESCLDVLRYIHAQKLGFGDFLSSIFYGDDNLRDDETAKRARRELTTSDHFPSFLRNLAQPPRTAAKGYRPRLSRKVFLDVSKDLMADEISQELDSFDKLLHMDKSRSHDFCTEDSPETLFEDIEREAPVRAPFLSRLLSEISLPASANVKADCKIINTILCQLSFRRNRYNNRYQKIIAMYFKAKATATKVVNLCHQMGVSMSYRWTTEAINLLSDAERLALLEYLKAAVHAYLITHDNVRITFKKETQRVNNQTHGDNGTSVTLIELHDPQVAAMLANYGQMYDEQQRSLRLLPNPPRLIPSDFFSPKFEERFVSATVHQLISILLSSAPFAEYEHRSDPILAALEPLHQLPSGKKFRTKFRMLGTWPIEEASYEGNLLVIEEVMKTLSGERKIPTEVKKEFGKRGIPWVGDWLTWSRLVHLKRLRNNDLNSFDRLKWLIPSFGWFHLTMLLANTILTLHRGSATGCGFSRSIHLLGIKGLPENNKKPSFHTVETLLDVELKSRALHLWLWATGKNTLEEVFLLFKGRDGAKKMHDCAVRIYRERVAATAIRKLESDGKGNDEVLQDAILCNRDLLMYFQVRNTIRQGDVGHLEALMPRLALFFKGSGNNNYASMLVEYMQWSRYEAPPGISDLVRDNCWLVNTSGRANACHAVDHFQEMNNLQIKFIQAPMGVNATWPLLNRLTSVVPMMHRVAEVVESAHNLQHSQTHNLPDEKKDVEGLLKVHSGHRLFEYVSERTRKCSTVKDMYQVGFKGLTGKWLEDHFTTRQTFNRHTNTQEAYDYPDETSDSLGDADLQEAGSANVEIEAGDAWMHDVEDEDLPWF